MLIYYYPTNHFVNRPNSCIAYHAFSSPFRQLRRGAERILGLSFEVRQ